MRNIVTAIAKQLDAQGLGYIIVAGSQEAQVKTFKRLPLRMLTKARFPFLYKQLAKNKELAKKECLLGLDGSRAVWYLILKPGWYDEELGTKTVHIADLEVATDERGKGYMDDIMSHVPQDIVVTLQANTERLIETYRDKYGFELFGKPEETGNLMFRKVKSKRK